MRTILVTSLVLLFSLAGNQVVSQTEACTEVGDDIDTTWAGGAPRMVCADTEYGIAWDEGEQIYFGRLDAEGNRIGVHRQISTGGEADHRK